MALENCSDCAYSVVPIDPSSPIGVRVCKRYPPNVISTPGGITVFQVYVKPEDWCGEWKADTND